MSKIRIMSHNLWKNDNNRPEWEEKGLDCSAVKRAQGFLRVYKELSPHVIGCQEMSPLMADEIVRGCLEQGQKYALLWGRDTPILYRSDLFELADSDFSLFPKELPGYEGEFNNYNTKSMNIALFRIKENGRLLLFSTAHLWWKSAQPTAKNYQPHSDKARVYQLGLLMDKLDFYRDKYNCPAIITGDLNCGYTSEALRSALERGYLHAHDVAVDTDESIGLHYCFGDGYEKYYYDYPFESAIDHILVNSQDMLVVRRFERYSPEYYFPLSDHSPTFIDAEI